MPNSTAQAQDEARRKLADEIEHLCVRRHGAEQADQPYAAHFLGKDLIRLISENQAVVLAALRADPARGAEEWNYDMDAAPKGSGNPVLVTVPAFAEGHAPFVGEAYYHEDESNEGWWWAGTSPGDYWASPIREVNAEPIAWRHLPEPAAIRALPASDEGGGE